MVEPKAVGSNPDPSKEVFVVSQKNRQSLCLGGRTKVRVSNATVTRRNTF